MFVCSLFCASLSTTFTTITTTTISIVTCYTLGYRSVGEVIDSTKQWSSSWRQSFEYWLGMYDRQSKTHPEVVATRHMTEDEELQYLYDKYIHEDDNNDDDKENKTS